MDRSRFMLAVLATSDGEPYSPAQVQKLFFLLDQAGPDVLGGPYFHFIPHDYGPYDPEVYDELRQLVQQDLVIVVIPRHDFTHPHSYRVTVRGQRLGETILDKMNTTTVRYLRQVSAWVRILSFAQLVSAIYKHYPEMQVNSVFRKEYFSEYSS